jgi:hypothetical protein
MSGLTFRSRRKPDVGSSAFRRDVRPPRRPRSNGTNAAGESDSAAPVASAAAAGTLTLPSGPARTQPFPGRDAEVSRTSKFSGRYSSVRKPAADLRSLAKPERSAAKIAELRIHRIAACTTEGGDPAYPASCTRAETIRMRKNPNRGFW